MRFERPREKRIEERERGGHWFSDPLPVHWSARASVGAHDDVVIVAVVIGGLWAVLPGIREKSESAGARKRGSLHVSDGN